jgi:hypothetical protein
MERQPIRQGDVLLKPIDRLPEGLAPTQNRVLAEGELTGHSHRLEGKAKVFRNGTGQLLVDVEDARLVHEEHGLVEPKGAYEVVRQVEYDPVTERVVQD